LSLVVPSLQGPLPEDARLVELRPDVLAFDTRTCMLPGTRLLFSLVMEERPLALEVEVSQCLVVDKDRKGYLYRSKILLSQIPDADRHLIELFIAKGRGAARLLAAARAR
jgi:hypothetical protein